MSTTRKPGLFDRLLDALAAFLGATAAASAVKIGRDPDPRDLRALGIRPEDFRKIGRY